jgi:gliding motility-associated-like protein
MRFSTGNEVVQLQNMAPAALNAGFERLKMLPGQKGIAAAGSWTSQFGDDAFFTQMKPDLSLDTDCCPRSENGDARINMLPGLMLETIVPSSAQPLLMGPWSPELVDANTPISSVCIPIDLNFSLSSDTICAGESITIDALGNTPGVNYQYIYSNAVPDPLNNNQLIFNQAGSVTRIGENTFCKVQATRFVQISTQAARFPNTFTPNQDGTNDVFQPKFFCPGSVQSLTIYNRWGNQVYSGDQAWDGKDAPSDVYYYIIVYRQAGVDTDLRASGQLTLLR